MGHYGWVQQKGTKEANNGLMKGDGMTKPTRTGETAKGKRPAPKYAAE